MIRLLVALLSFSVFSCSFYYLYLKNSGPSYLMTLTIPDGSPSQEVIVTHANIECKKLTISYPKDGSLEISIKTTNYNDGLACIHYVYTDIACNSNFKFPYNGCNHSGVQTIEFVMAELSGVLDIRQFDKSTHFRYILFYSLSLIFLYCVIYLDRRPKITP